MAVCLDYQSVYCSRRERVRTLSLQFVLGSVFLFSLLTKVWIHVVNTDLGYKVAKERKRTVTLNMERQDLELQLSVLMRRDSLSGMAARRLGLGILDPRQARKISYR